MKKFLSKSYKKLFFIFCFLFLNIGIIFAQKNNPVLEFYYGEECPHCHEEMKFLDKLEKKFPDLEIQKYEIWHDKTNREKLEKKLKSLNYKFRGVPINIINDTVIDGFDSVKTTGKEIQKCIIKNFFPEQSSEIINCEKDKFVYTIPWLGEINFSTWKWPSISISLGFIDGFNPCSMWVLVTLIAILVNLDDRKKLILIGSIFILASFIVYGIALVGWFIIFDFIKFLGPIQWILGFLSSAAGIYTIYLAAKNPTGACTTTSSDTKKTISQKIQRWAHEPKFWLMCLGMIALAFAVNLIELVCSIGIPPIFTGLLSISGVTVIEKWMAIFLYLVFYMLDDMIVFGIAVWSMKLKIFSGKGHFYLQLTGGILLLILGIWELIKLL